MNDSERQLIGLSTLLQLEKEARHAITEKEFRFVVVNETRKLLNYHQAIIWKTQPGNTASIEAISGLAQLDKNAPFIVWLSRVIKHCLRQTFARESIKLDINSLPDELHEGWKEWTPGYLLWCPLISPAGKLIGGLILSRDSAWNDSEVALLGRLSDSYAHAWGALTREYAGWREKVSGILGTRRSRTIISVISLVIIFFPVRQSVLAPAEVVADNPHIVSAPVEGVIKTFHVRPNQNVKKGDLLFSLDDTAIRNQNEIAKKSLAVAQADYLRAAQKAFSDEKSKSEMALLKSRVDQRTAELEYSADLLNRIHIKAEQDGVAVYNDPNDWLGKPVVVGEKVITLADPAETELQIWLPVDDAINLELGAEIRVFLNVNPTSPIDAVLNQTSYEAEITPENVLAFRLKAGFSEAESPPRIGLKGTAKIYGDRVVLIYYLFRRPFAAARRFLGI